MARGRPRGQPKSGGKKKGSKNRVTLAREEAERILAKNGITPLAFMVKQINLPMPRRKLTLVERMMIHDYRLRAATSAAPYLHPKLAQTEVRGPGPGGAHLNFNENSNTERLDPNDPGLLEAARRIAFVMAEGVRLTQKQEKIINPPKA